MVIMLIQFILMLLKVKRYASIKTYVSSIWILKKPLSYRAKMVDIYINKGITKSVRNRIGVSLKIYLLILSLILFKAII